MEIAFFQFKSCFILKFVEFDDIISKTADSKQTGNVL